VRERSIRNPVNFSVCRVFCFSDLFLFFLKKRLVQALAQGKTCTYFSAKDKVRLEVKRVFRFHKYPPDDQPIAVETVIEQAEMFAEELV
jgi:hypothetical protein